MVILFAFNTSSNHMLLSSFLISVIFLYTSIFDNSVSSDSGSPVISSYHLRASCCSTVLPSSFLSVFFRSSLCSLGLVVSPPRWSSILVICRLICSSSYTSYLGSSRYLPFLPCVGLIVISSLSLSSSIMSLAV